MKTWSLKTHNGPIFIQRSHDRLQNELYQVYQLTRKEEYQKFYLFFDSSLNATFSRQELLHCLSEILKVLEKYNYYKFENFLSFLKDAKMRTAKASKEYFQAVLIEEL